MEKIDYLTKARSRYTDQHSEDQVFDAIVQALIEQSIINQDTLTELETNIFDIDLSSDYLLDLIGYIVGQGRIINGTGEFFGFQEDISASGFGDMIDPEHGGFWYSLSNGVETTITVASDDAYRRMIKARIIFNNNLATPETLIRIINLLSNSDKTTLREDNTGNLIINIDGDPDNLVTYFLSIRETDRNLIPIPLGVLVGLNIIGNRNV